MKHESGSRESKNLGGGSGIWRPESGIRHPGGRGFSNFEFRIYKFFLRAAADIVGAVKPEAILYDLDDTLLVNSMDTFVPAYLGALTEFMADHVEPRRLTDSLLAAIRTMDRNTDWTRTNAEVFFEAFLPPLGRPQMELGSLFERFYGEVFPRLRSLTRPADGSQAAVRWAREAGHNVVVATNPMFPQTAIEQRIRWADLAPEEFDLVTTVDLPKASEPRLDTEAAFLPVLIESFDISNRQGAGPHKAHMA